MAEASAWQKGGWSARLGGHGIARAEPLTWVLRERVWGTALQKGRVESKTASGSGRSGRSGAGAAGRRTGART